MDIQNIQVRQLVNEVKAGTVVLPNFQRQFDWGPEDIRDLLVSIVADYYVGTMLYMDVVSSESDLDLRFVHGVEQVVHNAKMQSVVKVLLDGQQRCTALFYALCSPDLPLKGKKNSYRFVLDIGHALKDKWDDAVICFNSSNKRDVQKFSGDSFLSFSDFLDESKLVERITNSKWQKDLPALFKIINRFNNFNFQMVELRKNTPFDVVVEIFERINRTGLPLSITDLLVARHARHGINLREMIDITQQTYDFMSEENGVAADFILRLICLMRDLEIRKENILKLESENFSRDWARACDFLELAFKRITLINNGYGAVDFRRLCPFRTMIVPLAALMERCDRNNINAISSYSKIDEWYWVSVFGNRYNEAVNTGTFSDLQKVWSWIEDSTKIPDFIKSFNPYSIDYSVTSKSSSTYRGVLCLILLKGALDFKNAKNPLADISKVQDDHIFPRAGYSDNSILNRTLISSNAEKNNQHPSKYFSALETVHGKEGLLKILETHLINAECLEALIDNDLDAFKLARAKVITEAVTGRLPNIDLKLRL